MNLIPAAPGTTGDGLDTCTQCGRGVDPADMCFLPGNTDTCQDCASTAAHCVECGDEQPAAALDPWTGRCHDCNAALQTIAASAA